MCRSPCVSTLQVEARMAGEGVQHVVEEADAGGDADTPVPSRSTAPGCWSPWSRGDLARAVAMGLFLQRSPRRARAPSATSAGGVRSGRSPRRPPGGRVPQSPEGLPRARPNRKPAAYWSPAPVVSRTRSTLAAAARRLPPAGQDDRALAPRVTAAISTRRRAPSTAASNSSVSNRARSSTSLAKTRSTLRRKARRPPMASTTKASERVMATRRRPRARSRRPCRRPAGGPGSNR